MDTLERVLAHATEHKKAAPQFAMCVQQARHSLIHVRYTEGHTHGDLTDLVFGVKRNMLESFGYIQWSAAYTRLKDTNPHLEAPSGPLNTALPVVGVFTDQLDVMRVCGVLGCPVWRPILVDRLAPEIKILKSAEPTVPELPARRSQRLDRIFSEAVTMRLRTFHPSQFIYEAVPNTTIVRIVGSMNCTGQIVAPELALMMERHEAALRQSGTPADGGQCDFAYRST